MTAPHDEEVLRRKVAALEAALEEKSALLNAITSQVCEADFHLIGRLTAGWTIDADAEYRSALIRARSSDDVESALALLWERHPFHYGARRS